MPYTKVEITAKYNHKVTDEETGKDEELFTTEFTYLQDFGEDLKDALNKLAASKGPDGEPIGAEEAGKTIHQYYMLHGKVVGQNTSRAKMGELCKDISDAEGKPSQEDVDAALTPVMAAWVPPFKTSAKKTMTEKLSDVMKDLNAEQRAAVLEELARMTEEEKAA